MQLPPLFIRGKLSEVNPILSVVSYNRQRSHRHLQPALHPAELTTGGKWTYNRQCGHDYCVRENWSKFNLSDRFLWWEYEIGETSSKQNNTTVLKLLNYCMDCNIGFCPRCSFLPSGHSLYFAVFVCNLHIITFNSSKFMWHFNFYAKHMWFLDHFMNEAVQANQWFNSLHHFQAWFLSLNDFKWFYAFSNLNQ